MSAYSWNILIVYLDARNFSVQAYARHMTSPHKADFSTDILLFSRL